jgi:hypothetical protein
MDADGEDGDGARRMAVPYTIRAARSNAPLENIAPHPGPYSESVAPQSIANLKPANDLTSTEESNSLQQSLTTKKKKI